MRYSVLLTDYAWPDLDIESRILAQADAELIASPQGDERTLSALAKQADAIMTNWARVTRAVIEGAPKCRIIARLGIGLDNIDVACATSREIVVTNVPDYCITEVAEHAMALVLSLGREAAFYHWETKSGRYDLAAGSPLRRIEGQTLGIVGLGSIGRRVAQKAAALGMQVLATTRHEKRDAAPARWCQLDELLAASDYVSLHMPLAADTRHFIGRREFELMKPSAFLVNTARGGLVDHQALAEALAAGRIAGAALDVQDPEPPDLARPPYNDPRVIVTPHAAFVSEQSLVDLRTRASNQVAAALRGERLPHVVNPQVYAGRG